MNLDRITDYHVIAEVKSRWKCPPESLAIHRAVMKGVLKVCYWVNNPNLQEVKPSGDGVSFMPVLVAGSAAMGKVNAWCYPMKGKQTAAFEMSYSVALDESSGVARYWALPEPLLLSALLTDGVVMPSDLEAAEAVLEPNKVGHWQEKSAATKELDSMFRLISALAVDGYGYNPDHAEGKAETIRTLQAATSRGPDGKAMHQQTIAKYLDRALSEYPPEVALKAVA